MRILSCKPYVVPAIVFTIIFVAWRATMTVGHVPGVVDRLSLADAAGPASAPASAPAFRVSTSVVEAKAAARDDPQLADRFEGRAAPVAHQAPAQPAMAAGAEVSRGDAAAFWASQRLIRSGEVRILVKDVRRAITMADSIGRLHGALLADSRSAADAQTTRDAQLQFRVPADRFSETVAALRTIGDVRGESMTTQDVTKDYSDLETRLRVKDETVTRLRALLTTHAAKLGDVLQVEQELARAVTELEQLKGERRYYDQQVALSSVSLSLFEQQAVPPAARFIDPLVAACRRALEVLGTSIAGVVYGVVFILPWAVLATILWWAFTLARSKVSMGATGPAGPVE